MAGTWTRERFPQFADEIRQLAAQHRELRDEPLHLAVAYDPGRDGQDRFLFEVVDYAGSSEPSPERDLFETTFRATPSLPVNGGVFSHQVGRRHEVERFMLLLCRLPRDPDYKTIQSQIHGLLNETVRGEIHAIELLIPRWPPPGQLHARNTEYPFNDVPGSWRAPAEADVFTRPEVDRFRPLAFRLLQGCRRIRSALARIH